MKRILSLRLCMVLCFSLCGALISCNEQCRDANDDGKCDSCGKDYTDGTYKISNVFCFGCVNGALYDASGTRIRTSIGNPDFAISYQMQAGTEYYILVGFDSGSAMKTGEIQVNITSA